MVMFKDTERMRILPTFIIPSGGLIVADHHHMGRTLFDIPETHRSSDPTLFTLEFRIRHVLPRRLYNQGFIVYLMPMANHHTFLQLNLMHNRTSITLKHSGVMSYEIVSGKPLPLTSTYSWVRYRIELSSLYFKVFEQGAAEPFVTYAHKGRHAKHPNHLSFVA